MTNDGQGKEVVLALGSNLALPPGGAPPEPLARTPRGMPDAKGAISGRLANLQGAIHAIAAIPGVTLTAVSPVYETAPVGGPAQPDYLNAVLLARTSLAPRDLLVRLHEIEADFDRTREVRWGPRTLDLDIITVEGVISDDPELTLPHPRAHERAFVLAPWHDADPDAELPGHGAVTTLLAAVGDAGIRRADEELSRA